MEVHFKNHAENPCDLKSEFTTKVVNLTTLTSKSKVELGVGKVSFSNTNLDTSVYDIKVFIQDKENPASVKDAKL